MQNVTVIITAWRRFKNLERIIRVWLKEPEVKDIIIWDNSNTFETQLSCIVIRSSYNFGASVRYMLGAIIKTEIALFVDDDMIVTEGITKDLLNHFNKNRIIGIYGRNMTKSYQQGFEEEYDGRKITTPAKVNFIVGFLLMIHRDHLVDQYYGDDPQQACEVCLQGRLMKLEKLVVPSTKWEHLPEQWDENALSARPEAERIKEEMFQKYYANESRKN